MHPQRQLSSSPLINVMVAAIEKAGRAIVRDFGEIEQLQVSRKSLGDFVSTADKKSERILIQELQKARPGFSFLLEEGGEIQGTDRDHRWIVDPLDGTVNFLHGIPHFSISIALEREGEVVAGVIYNPITDELYCTEKGRGAFLLNQRRLRVSGRRHIDEALLATASPFSRRTKSQHSSIIKCLERITPMVAGVRRFGSAALDLAYVAAGRFEGYIDTGVQHWDMAAGTLLVREAGGYVGDFAGENNMIKTSSIIAGNEMIYPELQKIMAEYRNL